ncbi:MAG: LysM peptidoglycan-binding domain-containing protein [Bacteroidales bacterium]|nr:LysM peptidoglycan-binding domain-containing protein [Bacteroidales bacterium]
MIARLKLSAFILVVLLITTNCFVALSQVVVERSKEKVIISGVAYYIHQVKKGETAYSISRAYGITVEELTRENPPAVYGVNEGQSLRIPVKQTATVTTADAVPLKQVQKDESKFLYHGLQPGETVYSLSKLYGVSENEIIQSNQGIDINKLSVGYEIAIPKRVFMSDRQKFDDQEKKYIFHKVLKGESLSSIAEKYGLSVRELRKENRDLRFPQVGDLVRVPGVKVPEVEVVAPPVTDTIVVIAEEPEVKYTRPAGFTKVKDLKGSINVAVLLPFYFKENADRTEIDSSKMIKGKKPPSRKKPEEWIYQKGFDFLEMYQGILLAADTLRALGLDISISAFDIKDDTIEITRLINSGKLAGMDLIIGPVYSHNLQIVADYARNFGIPVVSPVTLMNNSVLVNNPTLFMANSSLEVAQKALAKRISENYDNNLVFIHADSIRSDSDVKRFKDMIFKELSYKLPYEEIKFKEFLFYSRSMFDNDSINRLSHALSESTKNIIIIASEDTPVISESLTEIHGLSKRFDVKVFGYPSLLDLDNLDPKLFFDLDLKILTPYWIDYTHENVKQFNSDYRRKFLTEPLEKSFAWSGYDIAYYFLSGLALNGRDFISNPEKHYPELLQTRFDFVRKEENAGFENQSLFMVRYTRDYEVLLVEEDSLFNH